MLGKKLREVLGSEKVKDSQSWRLSYAYDGTPTGYRGVPDVVVFPETTEDVAKILAFASEEGIPVYPRGAGSGLTGGAAPLEGGIVVSTEKMNSIVEIDEDNLGVLVEPGVVTYDLQVEVEKRGLFYPPDPSSYKYSTIGGNIAENAGGPRCVKYGVTKDYVMQLEVVFADGTVAKVGSKAVKSVAGYNLKDLIVGSEGTLAFITKAYLKLIPKPEAVRTALAVFPKVEQAAQAVADMFKAKVIPTACEFLDKNSIVAVERYAKIGLPTYAEGLLIIEVDGYEAVVDELISRAVEVCKAAGAEEIKTAATKQEREALWMARRAVSPAIVQLKPKKINEDVVVPRSRIPELIKNVYRIADKYNLMVVNFGHAGDGNIHVNFMYEPHEADRVEQAVREVFELTVALEGSISGEHGIGWMKKEFLPLEVGPALEKMKAVKRALDPKNILNPGKVFDL
ncbi:D-lactate dehydrogenase (cytochrome) [Thermovibrio ammonificans HB-1]|uniref:D-lactate dehydrogenase (Cytochrome) n=1 Tax=Thermovibrio ammonificans (strain DSM 15698 / JCM 12110 / HB-1) TaxID=648996 RepID=E8T2G0_THEA1|nr:FAD-linked oxidase C-terminal domain-containing protein [Thermovibrio ammonificans]ADU97055.1 D-lactate dehydrogenase (cytochrome) [Thermovibrio ammonificans HB-1]